MSELDLDALKVALEKARIVDAVDIHEGAGDDLAEREGLIP